MSALNFLSTDTRLVEQAKTIVERLHSHGYQAYFAGGCVRDALRQAPVKDIDIATSATPEEVSALFPAQSIGVGKSFGVMASRMTSQRFEQTAVIKMVVTLIPSRMILPNMMPSVVTLR